MVIKTSDLKAIKPFLKKFYLPPENSHKGQNGKVLIIGGSSLFHAASIWGAEVASHFADLVHYCSTEENNKVFLAIKKKFRNGIVIAQKDLLEYVTEDDAILVGLGMIRGKLKDSDKKRNFTYEEILKIKEEPLFTYTLNKFLIENFPTKKFVFDAGAIQMMNPDWLLNMKQMPIITPHVSEFKGLFGRDTSSFDQKKTSQAVKEMATKYKCVIVLKKKDIFISNGTRDYIVEGGNAGLTKGGTGDILAGLIASFYAKNDPLTSAVLAAFVLKKSSEKLFSHSGYWYNIGNIIGTIPKTLFELTLKK